MGRKGLEKISFGKKICKLLALVAEGQKSLCHGIVSFCVSVRASVHLFVCPLTFSHLCDKVHIFELILLKLAQSICMIVRINPFENEENPSNIMGKGHF